MLAEFIKIDIIRLSEIYFGVSLVSIMEILKLKMFTFKTFTLLLLKNVSSSISDKKP